MSDELFLYFKESCFSGAAVSSFLGAIMGAFFIRLREELSPLRGQGEPALASSSPAATTLYAVVCLAVLSNFISVIAAFVLVAMLAAFRVKQQPSLLPSAYPRSSPPFYLLWRLVARAWLLSLTIGFFSPFLEFALYTWLMKANLPMKILVVVFCFMCTVMLGVLWQQIFRLVIFTPADRLGGSDQAIQSPNNLPHGG